MFLLILSEKHKLTFQNISLFLKIHIITSPIIKQCFELSYNRSMSHTGKPFHVFIISSKWRPVNNPPPPSKKNLKNPNQNKTKTIKQTSILKPLSMEDFSHHHQKWECGKVSGCISFALNFLPCISMVTSVFVKCFWFIRYR